MKKLALAAGLIVVALLVSTDLMPAGNAPFSPLPPPPPAVEALQIANVDADGATATNNSILARVREVRSASSEGFDLVPQELVACGRDFATVISWRWAIRSRTGT